VSIRGRLARIVGIMVMFFWFIWMVALLAS
jgi:hypothetical protein